MNRTLRTFVGILTATTLLAACGQESLPLADPFGDPPWRLIAGVVDGAPLGLVDTHPITLVVDGTNAGGVSACNRYGATLVQRDGTVTFSDVTATEMACTVDGVMELESTYLRALAIVDGARLEGDHLVLTGPGVTMRFAPGEPGATGDLEDITWVLDEMFTDGTLTDTVAEAWIRLAADGSAGNADGNVTGHNGCNGFGGHWDSETGFRDLYQTLIGCMGDIADQETLMMGILDAADEVRVEDGRLTITSGQDALHFVKEIPTPDASLIGTPWTLHTLIDGEAAFTTAAQARITFNDDGTVGGFTGCNEFGGTYTADDGFGELWNSDAACGDAVGDQESLILGVLAARPTLSIEGNTLTIEASDGRALMFGVASSE